MKRIAPAIALFLLAPLIGEYLLGNLPMSDPMSLAAYPVLALLYGGGAVLIRELVARTGRGFGSVVLLAIGYGIIEEGLITQSLFNPAFQGLPLHEYGEIPALGMGAAWTIFVLTIHSVWSIVVPIALVQLLFPGRGPWLKLPGTIGYGFLYLLGAAASAAAGLFTDPFIAAPGQFIGAGIAALSAGVAAFTIPRSRKDDSAAKRDTWRPRVIAVTVFAAGSVLFLAFQLGATWRLFPAPVGVSLMVIGIVTGFGIVLLGSRRPGWSRSHVVASVAGALAVYCWAGFLVQGRYGYTVTGTLPQLLLVAGAMGLLYLAWRRNAPAEPITPA